MKCVSSNTIKTPHIAGKKKRLAKIIGIAMVVLFMASNIYISLPPTEAMDRSSSSNNPGFQDVVLGKTGELGDSLANSSWPIFHGNAKHTGLSPYNTSRNSGIMKWKFRTGENIWSSPVIDEKQNIYIHSQDGYLYSVSYNGTMNWKFETYDRYISSPVISEDGTIYVGSSNSYLYAINSNGTMEWRFKTENEIRGTPAIAEDGTIYIGSYDDYMYALHPNGTVKWRFRAEDILFSAPAIGSDRMIYFGSRDHHLYALYPNGTMKWRFEADDYVCSSPAIGEDGVIYVGSDDGNLYAIGLSETFDIPVHTGWNLISYPLLTRNDNIEDVLKDDVVWDYAQYYNTTSKQDHWKTSVVGRSVNDMTSIDNTKGIWLHVVDAGDGYLRIHGTAPPRTSIILHSGWNLVSYPSSRECAMNRAGLPSDVIKIASYDPDTTYLISEVPDRTESSFVPGNAYWLYSTAGTVWTVDY